MKHSGSAAAAQVTGAKNKMADEQKISVASQRAVYGIHEKMRHEIHQVVENKPWSSEKKEEFKAKLLEVGRFTF